MHFTAATETLAARFTTRIKTVDSHTAGETTSLVIGMQADILLGYGVPVSVAESLLEERIKEVERRIMPTNFMRPVDESSQIEIAIGIGTRLRSR